MEVILNQDFPALGYIGDRVRVKPGYARNFLIPRGIAIECSGVSSRYMQHRLSGIAQRKLKLKEAAQELGKKLEDLQLEFMVRLGAHGKAFGSIGLKDIEAELLKRDFKIDRRQIKLSEALRKPGEYKVLIKLHSEVSINLPLVLRSELPEKQTKTDAAAEKRKSKTSKVKAKAGKEVEQSVEESSEKETLEKKTSKGKKSPAKKKSE